jgi:hypothetical protein
MDLPRHDQLVRVYAAELLDANPNVALDAVLRDGLDANLLAHGAAAMGDEVVSQLSDVARNLIMETATGPGATRLGLSQHGLLPKPAAAPFVDQFFYRAGLAAVVTAFTIPAGTKIRSADGKQYETVLDLAIAAGTTVPQSVRARSTLAGSSQAVAANKLTSITSTIPGAPTDLITINLQASAGGADAEREDDYKNRCKAEPRSRARGTRDALVSGALLYPGVVRATAFEGIDSNGRANRLVGIVISDQFVDSLVRQGVSLPTYDSQSQAFARVVERYLDEYRAYGIHVSVIVAQVAMVSTTLRLRFRANANTERTKLAAAATVVNYVNALASGQPYVPSAIVTALRAVNGLDVRGDEIENPAGTIVTSSPYQVLRTNLSLVHFSTGTGTESAFNIITV